MHAVYRMESKYIIDSEENYCSIFSSKLHIEAQYQPASDDYAFIITRLETCLNGKPPEKLMDKIMCETGNSYYPLHLRVSPKLRITEVINFNEIRQRWQTCMKDLLEKNPSSDVERYFRFSGKNMAGSNVFIPSLYRDTFYNLYFRDIFTVTAEDEVRPICWYNFPKRETNQTYLYRVKADGINTVRLSGEIMKIIPENNGEYETTYETGDRGEIRKIGGKMDTTEGGSRYIKLFALETKTPKTIKKDIGSFIIDE
jgi:hypothetical protein